MLQHMSKAHGGDGILCSMDVVAGILERTLDHEGRWVASFRCTCMVRASISTLGLDVGNGAVLRRVRQRVISAFTTSTYSSDDLLDEVGKSSVNIVCNHTNGFLGARLDVACHILLEHGLDDLTAALVVCEDSLAAQEPSFFSSIPMKLDGVRGLTTGHAGICQQHSERLQNRHLEVGESC
jgi:hypothetical protein